MEVRGRRSTGVYDRRFCRAHEHVVCSRESENMEAQNGRNVEVEERKSSGAKDTR